MKASHSISQLCDTQKEGNIKIVALTSNNVLHRPWLDASIKMVFNLSSRSIQIKNNVCINSVHWYNFWKRMRQTWKALQLHMFMNILTSYFQDSKKLHRKQSEENIIYKRESMNWNNLLHSRLNEVFSQDSKCCWTKYLFSTLYNWYKLYLRE